jgi:hypothetical protein
VPQSEVTTQAESTVKIPAVTSTVDPIHPVPTASSAVESTISDPAPVVASTQPTSLDVDGCLGRPVRTNDLSPARAAVLAAGSMGYAWAVQRWERFNACFATADLRVDELHCGARLADYCIWASYQLGVPKVAADGNTATIRLSLSSGKYPVMQLTTGVVDGTPRILAFEPQDPNEGLQEALPTIQAYFAATTSGNWDAAAELLTVDALPISERPDLAPLFATAINNQVAADAGIAERLEVWCAQTATICLGLQNVMSFEGDATGGTAGVQLTNNQGARLVVVTNEGRSGTHLLAPMSIMNATQGMAPTDPAKD